jgi:hydrogenase maturation protease
MTSPRILVAGIGNIFLGDDAFGVEVARRMVGRKLPPEVQVRDFGIRGLDLAYTILDGVEFLILVDAMPRGGEPGTLYLLEPDLDLPAPGLEGHGMNPMAVLGMVRTMGGTFGTVRIVGCEPGPIDLNTETDAGLSPAVQAAIEGAVTLVETLIRDHLESSMLTRS